MNERRIQILILLVVAFSPFMHIVSTANQGNINVPGTFKNGPFIDKIVLRTILDPDARFQALADGEIDVASLEDEADFYTVGDIMTESIPENGYYYAMFNVNKYPLNISSFRRALAFALDKEAVCNEESLEGEAPEPIDSVIPKSNPYSIEGQLTHNYYAADIEIGNQLLDLSGFNDTNEDGLREAPNGSRFSVEVFALDYPRLESCASHLSDALEALGISVTVYIWEYMSPPRVYEDFGITIWGVGFSDFNPEWLAYDDWSGHATIDYAPFPSIRNSTYSYWSDILVNSTDPNLVNEAIITLQQYWAYECAVIPIFQLSDFSLFRADRFEDFVIDPVLGVANWWTAYRAHLNFEADGPWGGIMTWGISERINSFNFLSAFNDHSTPIFELLYDSLFRRGPTGDVVLWLAESYTTETHEDNDAVPAGHTRYSFNIVRNATWSDGTPLTAQDVAYSLNLFRETLEYPFIQLSDMTSAIAPTNYTVVVEYSSESFWNLHDFAYLPVLPKHVFTTLPADSLTNWDPQPPHRLFVTSGPFNITGYDYDEYIELTWNPTYFRSYWPVVDPIDTQTWPSPFEQQIWRISIIGTVVVAFIVFAYTVRKEIRHQ
ncbi:MAG: ABC transporter substrate-binding protein [Candidatus Thorarchaeota archaeon]